MLKLLVDNLHLLLFSKLSNAALLFMSVKLSVFKMENHQEY